ncbi:RT16, ribosomal protein 16 mitochondrial small ribosomal subunit, partial [Thalassiosira pseudonana CCMP1335]
MVVRLRLQRFGRTHSPFYRMVAADSRAPRDGKFLEIVGTYNPIANNAGIKEIRLKADRLRYWISVGAQPSDRVAWILGKFGILPPPPQ